MQELHRKLTLVSIMFATLLLTPAARAAPFRNLNFEESPFGPGSGESFSEPISLLFPGWTVRYDEFTLTNGTLNTYLLAGGAAALFTSPPWPGYVIEGTRSAFLTAWLSGNRSTSISQAGMVPTGTQSLRFIARSMGYPTYPEPPGPFFLTVDSQGLPLFPVSFENGQVIYGADVAALAGLTAEIRIELRGFQVPGYYTSVSIDAIEFSPLPVPEPGMAGIAVAAMAALWRRSTRREGNRSDSN